MYFCCVWVLLCYVVTALVFSLRHVFKWPPMSLESVSASLGCIVPIHVLGPSDHAQAATMLANLSDSGVEDDGASAMPESQEGAESASSAPATPKAKAKAKGKKGSGNMQGELGTGSKPETESRFQSRGVSKSWTA